MVVFVLTTAPLGKAVEGRAAPACMAARVVKKLRSGVG